MARIDRQKRALGGAIKRKKPSTPAKKIIEMGLVNGRVLDYGCGFGFDADIYNWDSYDPFYRPNKPKGHYDTIMCFFVLNALTFNNRRKVIEHINSLLSNNGNAYLAVPRDLPRKGKLGINHSLQNYVVLTLPVIFEDEKIVIYKYSRDSNYKDKTIEFISRRDKRKDR